MFKTNKNRKSSHRGFRNVNLQRGGYIFKVKTRTYFPNYTSNQRKRNILQLKTLITTVRGNSAININVITYLGTRVERTCHGFTFVRICNFIETIYHLYSK